MSNVISEKRQKNTLRGKKGRKGTVKNVLASPYTHYWPLIKNGDDIDLKRILASNLPRVKGPKPNIPWEQIKHIPKEERADFRKKLSQFKQPVVPKCIYFGINEVTKLLEKGEAVSVLLGSEVSPQLMVKHVLDLCVYKHVSALVVPDLKALLNKITGVSAAAIAFGPNALNEPKINLVCENINQICQRYPIPETHAAFVDDDSKFLTSVRVEKPEKSHAIRNVYLYRDPSENKRVFIPKSSIERKNIPVKMDVDSQGFLSIEDKLSVNKYKSLIVKQVTNNPDRNKRKLEMIKNRKKKLRVV